MNAKEKKQEKKVEKISYKTILYDVELKDVIDVVNELITKQGEIVDWVNKQTEK